MNLLVIGGSGFVGTNVITFLTSIHTDWEIEIYSRSSSETAQKNLSLLQRKHLVTIIDVKSIRNNISKYDLILDFGDNADLSISDSKSDLELEMLLKNVSKHVHYIFLSSTEVYGDVNEGDVVSEETEVNPKSSYAKNKLRIESTIKKLSQKYFLPNITIIRSCSLYGLYQFGNKLIPNCIRRTLLQEPIDLINKQTHKTYLHISEFCYILHEIILNKVLGTYNVSGTECYSNQQILQIIRERIGVEEDFYATTSFYNRENDGERYPVSIEKLKQKITWYQSSNFLFAIDEIIEYVRKEMTF
jgi:dTDP-glucose 4,6-dehydratase